MMIRQILNAEREKFKADMLQQLHDFKQNGLSYTFDNLMCGIKVLEGNDPTITQTQDSPDGNEYHLILHRDAQGHICNAELRFRDLEGRYVSHALPPGELLAFVLQDSNTSLFHRKSLPHNVALHDPHLIVRNKKLLQLVENEIHREELNKPIGSTKVEENKSLEEQIQLLSSVCERYTSPFHTNNPDNELELNKIRL